MLNNDMKFMFITNEVDVALTAQSNGIHRIWIDLETYGKAERQKNMDTVKSNHCIEDIRALRPYISQSEILVRVNPMNPNSEKEINDSIEAGADAIMLPMFKSVDEVKLFLRYVNKRTKAILLLETSEAEESIEEIVKLTGIDEIHIGLNDLHLSHQLKFMFELLTNGTVEKLCRVIRQAGIVYGFGGIARLGKGDIPAEMILAEHVRLGSSRVILSRSFFNADKEGKEDMDEKIQSGVKEIEEYIQYLKSQSEDFLQNNKKQLQQKVKEIVECSK